MKAPAKFRKKPVVIEAIRFNGQNAAEIGAFVGYPCGDIEGVPGSKSVYPFVVIETLEGDMRGEQGDWIIKGVKGEFYPCKPDIFELTYDHAE